MVLRSPSESTARPGSFSRAERVQVALLLTTIAGATAIGLVASVVVGQAYPVVAGLGIIAYVLGLRHGVDADHIAAIDNTTRKLLQDGKRPIAVGSWFSLGHSTIVIGLIVALVLAVRAVIGQVATLASVGSVVGAGVSGVFLWVIGLINLVIVFEIYRIFRGLQAGRFSPAELDAQLSQRGFLNRYFGRLFGVVREPWQIYPVGVLFGLGFDTASEIALIAVSTGIGLTSSAPVWIILLLPLLFTCGMILVDTIDGVAMRAAYGWAFVKPIRKIYYNLTLTVISVLVALAVGTLELVGVLATELHPRGGAWATLSAIDLESIGFLVLGIFLAAWLVALAYYRYRRFEQTPWPPPVAPGAGPARESP